MPKKRLQSIRFWTIAVKNIETNQSNTIIEKYTNNKNISENLKKGALKPTK